MFSLDDHNSPKVHFIALFLERTADGHVYSNINIHAVVARNDAEALGIIQMAYANLKENVEIKYWQVWGNFIPTDIQEIIDENNIDLKKSLVVPGKRNP